MENLVESFSKEFSQMKIWYDASLSRSNRTSTGVSGLLPEEAVAFILAFIKGEEPDRKNKNTSLPDTLRLAAEDIKAFYFEGISAQPGQATDSKTLADWFWGETHAALVINEVRKTSLKYDSKTMKLLGSLLLVPRNQMYRFRDPA